MIHIDRHRTPADLLPKIEALFALSAAKILAIEAAWDPKDGSPVFTVEGRYRARGWTEWTQGFQFGAALLQFDATGDARVPGTRARADRRAHGAAPDARRRPRSRVQQRQHLRQPVAARPRGTHSTRRRGKSRFYELALEGERRRAGPAMDAHCPDGGFIYSFNGAHSLFVDTIRSLRALALGHLLGHDLMEEQDVRVSLLERLVQHARATARYSVFYGNGRDRYDVRGRTAHEILFNVANGSCRGPSTQQGYSPFSTWTRGLAWAMLGFAEQLEFVATLPDAELEPCGGRDAVESMMLDAARATCDRYLEDAAADGVPYWDTGAPGLARAAGLAGAAGGSVQRSRAGRQFGGGHRARRGCCVSRACWRRAARQTRPRATSRPGCACSTRCSTTAGPYLSTDAAPPGTAAARGVSLAERVGPRAGRLAHPARRVVHVGRLPPA